MICSKTSRAGWVTFFIAPLLITTLLLAPSDVMAAVQQGAVVVTFDAEQYTVTDATLLQEVSVGGFGRLLIPGKPNLPSKIFAVAIPPGAEVVDVRFDAGEGVELPDAYKIAPATLPRVIGDEDPAIYQAELSRYQANYDRVYGSDEVYPAEPGEFVRVAGYRKYNLVDLRITPFAYQPQSGRLAHYPHITACITYELDDSRSHAPVDDLVRTERIAEEIVTNYDQAREWYPPAGRAEKGLHDFVIVTLDSLTSSVAPLVAWETGKGRTVEVVTTSWIDSNYTGYDQAERIRNFLRDKYPAGEWGIEDVLLVGHYDDVPMRRTSQDLGYGEPETDFYYAELSLADSQSWDSDGDHLWGEDADSIDFYSEVNVGRIPWSDPATVQSICEKSAAYEQNSDPAFKKNILLLGGYFWADTDNAVLMEAKVDQPWMADWTMTRMYEQNVDYHSTYPCDYELLRTNVLSVWSGGQYAFVNWAGHGSPTSSHIYGLGAPAFIASSDCSILNDDYPAIIFADACSNSDTDHLNIGQAMLQKGGVGFVGATKVALGCPAWTGPSSGSTQSLDYYFTTAVTSGDYTQGQAHQWAMRQMYTNGLWGYVKYETFEWGALWGNPNLGMSAVAALNITLPNGAPESLTPGVATVVEVEITGGAEQYVPGSATMYYRYDGGMYLTATLSALGGDLYEAVLPPAVCADTPEFFFGANGDGGTAVMHPYSAPDATFTALVGELTEVFADDFEADQGWSVSGDATAGQWDRGTPVGGGDRGDPAADCDGSGQCYLTQNVDGDSDVDGGYTYLDSPTIDLSGGDAGISYALWYSNSVGGDPNNDLFKTYVSNDDGGNWTLVETIGPASTSGWNYHSFNVADHVTPTALVKVRFEASDINGGSVVEAGIDDFQVVDFSCSEVACPGDLDGDLDVDLSDLATMLANYGATSGMAYNEGDMDGDGDVDLSDLASLLAEYGAVCF